MSKFKNEIQNQSKHNSSVNQTPLSFFVSVALSLSLYHQSGAVQCSAAQRSLRNEETHRLRMGCSDCVLRGAYDRDPSHSSE